MTPPGFDPMQDLPHPNDLSDDAVLDTAARLAATLDAINAVDLGAIERLTGAEKVERILHTRGMCGLIEHLRNADTDEARAVLVHFHRPGNPR